MKTMVHTMGYKWECATYEGRVVEKQENVPIEELEEEIREMRTPAEMDELEEWLKSRPPKVEKVARMFPPWQLYRIKEGAPYRFTVSGSVVSAYKFVECIDGVGVDVYFRVLQSPIGYAGVVAHISPAFLEPITLDDLKEEVKDESH